MAETIYRKIVIPLDGSPLAEVALPYAEELAGKLGTKIVLFTVLPSDGIAEQWNHRSYTNRLVDITRQQVVKYRGTSGNGTITVETATRNGNPAEGILEYANKGYLSLIVMATHGRSGIGRWAVGSVADKVVRATKKQPVMLIRAKGCHPEVRAKRIFKKALVPLDGSSESEAVIPYISEIAANLNMELILLRVITKSNQSYRDTEAYLEKWCGSLTERGITSISCVRTGAAADEIIDTADEIASDIVAMSTRGQTAANLWSLGSVAQKVLLGGNTPLMLIKD